MEMNVSIIFKFEDEKIHEGLTEAFSKVYDYPGQKNYSNQAERAAEFKILLNGIFKSDKLIEFTDDYSNNFEGLEDIKINEGGATRLTFLCGSTGDLFAEDFQILLEGLGAEAVKIYCEADFDLSSELSFEEDDWVVTVEGKFLEPEIPKGSKLMFERFELGDGLIPGELVAVKEHSGSNVILKSVLADEEETVTFKNAQILINDTQPDIEDWPGEKTFEPKYIESIENQLKPYSNIIPPGEVLVIGNNSGTDFLSGQFSLIPQKMIVGRVYHVDFSN